MSAIHLLSAFFFLILFVLFSLDSLSLRPLFSSPYVVDNGYVDKVSSHVNNLGVRPRDAGPRSPPLYCPSGRVYSFNLLFLVSEEGAIDIL